MNVLAIDTSTRDLSLALAVNGKTVKYKNAIKSKDLARELPRLLEGFLKGTGVPLQKVNAVAVGLGPGSFTGLRVGVAAVQALSFGLGIAAYGVSSSDAIAYRARKKAKKICVLVDARRNLFYGSHYSSHGAGIRRESDYLLSPAEDILKTCSAGTLLIGDGVALVGASALKAKKLVADKGVWKPQARDLLALLRERIDNNAADDPAALAPIYLYPEDCQAVKHKA